MTLCGTCYTTWPHLHGGTHGIRTNERACTLLRGASGRCALQDANKPADAGTDDLALLCVCPCAFHRRVHFVTKLIDFRLLLPLREYGAHCCGGRLGWDGGDLSCDPLCDGS